MAQLGLGIFLLIKQPVQAGFRSPLPIPQLAVLRPSGYRSLFAFWSGGASGFIEEETTRYYGENSVVRLQDREELEIMVLLTAMYEAGQF